MKNLSSTSKKIPRRYSLTKSEKTTLGKSLLRYIQVSHYFEKPTVTILNENVRNDLINKQKEEIERTDLEQLIKKNEKKVWREINHKLVECIDERVNLRNIDKQKNWLKKMIDENPPEGKTEIERKIRFRKNIHENADQNYIDIETNDMEEYKERIKGEKNDDEAFNIHIKSEKGFPFLNFQYNNIEETVTNWNPPSIKSVIEERDFSRKLRVIRKGETKHTSHHTKENEIDENNVISKYDNESKSEMESDEEDQSYYKIPVIGELMSEHQLKEKFEEEDNIYLRQYLDEIKCDTKIIDFVKEKNKYKRFKKWLKKNKLKLKKREIVPEDNQINSKTDNIFDSVYDNSDQDDEARDLHTRNDFRRFDILLDSNLFGYCDYDETDHVLNGIIEKEKSKRKNDISINQIVDKEKNKDTQFKEKLKKENNVEVDKNKKDDEEDQDEDDFESDEDDDSDDDTDSDSDDDDEKEEKLESDGNYGKGENLSNSLKSTNFNKNMSKQEKIKNETDSSHFNRMLNMLLNAGAEIDDDEEKIIKEERREEQNLGRLRMPKTVNNLGSLNNTNYTESLKEYYEKKKKLRINLRSKILKEYKNEKEYSLELFYNNPVMLQSFIQKMDNQISEEKKKYEYEQSEKLHLSYKLKFMIEKNAHLNYSISKAEKEINNLNNEYIDKTEYIKSYSKKLEEELIGLEKLQSILINSLGMLSHWCVCEPEYLDPKCTKNWEKSSIALVPGGRPSHALLICKRICQFDSRLSKLYSSMYIHNYKVGLKILKKRATLNNANKIHKLDNKDRENEDHLKSPENNNHNKNKSDHLSQEKTQSNEKASFNDLSNEDHNNHENYDDNSHYNESNNITEDDITIDGLSD
ncbi:uncharacterized protein ELE39_002008 [Cryptosporidium sp. chipmunk genotype I]|uniref:uncharacterized protein n=1 Tax=Cryptosporidium sp. chipmunk genotype I TaxID=1280935 RepID=UPI003519DC2F|nr:hypothetical protein ELE39_002008 [Cryptosporidium sp. chipmunk genotype I]